MPQKPPRLEPGDTIALIAPASAPPDPKTIDKSVEVIESMGFKVRLGRNARARWGYLAGKESVRAKDINAAFADKRINGIFCVRGGYGTAHLLRAIDYKTVRENPKVFVGYSDITSLHCAFLKSANLVTFHGPMFASDFIKKETPPFAIDHFLRAIGSREAPRSICADYEDRKSKVEIIKRGRATGRLIGGNLSLLCTTLGTRWQPGFKGKILFIEELSEAPYGIDRNLTHLLNAGLLEQVAGVALGQFSDCADSKAKGAKEYRQSLMDVFRDRLKGLGVPVVAGLPFGHVAYNATLPIGVRVTLDGNKGDLIIEESGVK